MNENLKHKILLISEEMAGNQDEGLKRFVNQIFQSFSLTNQVLMGSKDIGEFRLSPNRLLLGIETSALVRNAQPLDGVFYFPRATATTFGALLRAWILQIYFKKTPVVYVALQQGRSLGGKIFSAIFWPRCAFLPTQAEVRLAAEKDHSAFLVLPGTDLTRFRPCSESIRRQIRENYHIHPSKPVFLHVGHLKKNRGLELLIAVKQAMDCEIFVVTSTTTHAKRDRGLRQELEDNGIRVWSDFFPNIERIYQAADCYLFPVLDPGACISCPLSILEAMATNLPVVTYPFGELPTQFSESAGLYFAQDPQDFIRKSAQAIADRFQVDTRRMVSKFSWSSTSQELLQRLADCKMEGGR